MWQEIIVGCCVLAATLFLVWRWLPVKRKKSAGCDSGCSGCSSSVKTCSTAPSKPNEP